MEPIGIALSADLGPKQPDVLIDFFRVGSRRCGDPDVFGPWDGSGICHHGPVGRANPPTSGGRTTYPRATSPEHESVGKPGDEAGRIGWASPPGITMPTWRSSNATIGSDAPSGTALAFGRIICRADGPQPTGPWSAGSARASGMTRSAIMPFGPATIRASARLSSACWAGLEITVRATNRDCYARGLWPLPRFLAGKPPGLLHAGGARAIKPSNPMDSTATIRLRPFDLCGIPNETLDSPRFICYRL